MIPAARYVLESTLERDTNIFELVVDTTQRISISGTRRAIAVARDQAMHGMKVVLVEAPRPRSILGPMFGVSADAAGLYEMIQPPPRNRFDTIYPTGTKNLYFVPSGDCRFRPTIWEMDWLRDRLEQHFNCIVTEYDD